METSQDLDQFIARHDVFIRKARDISRQSLYYLGILTKTNHDKTDRKLAIFAKFVLVKIRAFVNGVHVQKEYFSRKAQADQDACTRRMLDQFDYWQTEIRGKINNMATLELDDVQELREKFETFLTISQKSSFAGRLIYHHIPMALRLLNRHLYFIIGGILVAVAFSSVDAVKNLLLNEGRWVLLPLLGVLITLGTTGFLYIRWPLLGIGRKAFWTTKTASPGFGIQRWPGKNKDIQNLIFYKLLINAIIVISILIVYSLFLYILARLDFDLIGRTSLTVYGFFALALIFLLFCFLIDIWDFFDSRPIRLSALALGALFLFFSFTTGYSRLAAIVIFFILFVFAIRLIKHAPEERKNWLFATVFLGSIILLIVGGVTQKKDIWSQNPGQSNIIRISSNDWPYNASDSDKSPVVLMAASGGGSRAAVYTALTLEALHEDFPLIASKLQAISSVSGGSLATAAYISRRYRDFISEPGPKRLKNLADDVNQDFLMPTLIGALVPGESRGKSIENDWRSGPVGLKDIRLGHLIKGWKHAKQTKRKDPPYPIPLFNSCSLDGHDVVISPLDKSAYQWGQMYSEPMPWSNPSGSDDRALTWVYYRDAIYGLEEFLPNFDPLLAGVVRASANFPFGFPLVQIETTKPMRFNPRAEMRSDAKKTIKLTDGGVLSNSGMWSLFNLLMQKSDILKQRGVLLIMVEASRMPEYRDNRSGLTSLYETIGDKNPFGQSIHRRMFDLLAFEYGSKLAVVQLDLTPKEDLNIYTTWALDKRSFKTLNTLFMDSWNREKKIIRTKWESIKQERSFPPKFIPATQRPPLS